MPQPRNKELEFQLLRLFQDKRLNSKDDLLTLFCKRLGFEHAETKLPSRSTEYWGDGQVAELVSKESFEILAQNGDPRVGGFAVIYGTLHDFNLSDQRTIILQLRKTFRDALYVFAKPQTFGREQGAQIDVVHAHLRTAAPDDGATLSRLLIRRFRFGPGERYRTAAERLAKLDLGAIKSPTATAITGLCNDAFDKEALTNEFFKKLDAHIKAIESDLREHQGMSGPEAFGQAQLLTERLIFLYFAQNRGWLNQEADYLVRNFEKYRDDGTGFGYYQEFLHLLFHTLAEPDFGNRLQGIPFLNGGLFDDDEFRLPASKLKIRNATFAELFKELLEAYNFTVREDTPLSQEVAVDPEMLGKIFESIVLLTEQAGLEEYRAPDKRKATGSYYTPRIVVHFICRENLRLYFAQRSEALSDPACRGTWGDRITRLFKEIDPTDGFSDEEVKTLKSLLSPEEAKRCLELLLSIRTLDPAVGSGAFPVGLLHELICLQRIFETVAHGYDDPVKGSGTRWVQEKKEYFIQHSLFGVDIQQQAIEICRLRLWLSLLVDHELGVNPFEAERSEFIAAIKRISQLPNLEMNFKRGDSLHDYICGHPVRIEPQKPSEYAAELERIERLGAKLHKTTRGATKKKLRLEILEKRIALARRVIDDEVRSLSDQSFNLSTDFFGNVSLSDSEKRRRIEDELQRLKIARKQLDRDDANLKKLRQLSALNQIDFYRKLRELEGSEMDGPLNFAWRIDFPHVLASTKSEGTLAGNFELINEAGGQMEIENRKSKFENASGFDLIVGNPPFVTARNAQKRELYRERWPRVAYKTYLLVSPFFELSFGLLRPDGQLGFIVSNAFAKREFGKPLVEDFFPTVDLQKIIDCSGLLFPGHGTPTCLVFGAQRKPDENSPIRVAAILPGADDLRTPPEESALWYSLAHQHENPGYSDERIAVVDRARASLSKWPWHLDSSTEPLQLLLEAAKERLNGWVSAAGRVFATSADDIFLLHGDALRRHQIASDSVSRVIEGDEIRNWSGSNAKFVVRPYGLDWRLLSLNAMPETARWLKLFRVELGSRASFSGGTYDQAGVPWYGWHQLDTSKVIGLVTISFSEIATHGHFLVAATSTLFTQTSPVIKLMPQTTVDEYHVVCGLLNSAAALLWLKQVCFNKGAGEEEQRDRFVYAANRVQQLPIPAAIVDALRGKSNALGEALRELARECCERGRELPSLALRKLFEKPNETYHAWNASLPGYLKPHKELGAPFSSTKELQKNFERAQEIREKLRCEMIARQEEMDWLVYAAYGLIEETNSVVGPLIEDVDLTLDREERPFRLLSEANGDFEKASALVPASWSARKKKLWRARLESIRDNEHIARIEQPVYKRRWDEQWKVGNCWECGAAAYAQELIDAFTWWLSEKAEWHLEHKAKGGPIAVQDWSAALFKDSRVAAAWPVIADAMHQVEKYKFDALDDEKKETRRKPKTDDSYTAFERFFRETILDQSVAHGIPPAVPWSELTAKKKWTPAQFKNAQRVRGKLNVPRERFQQTSDSQFVWAGAK